MNRTAKGAVAAGAAGCLLLAAGALAHGTAEDSATTTGRLDLARSGCEGWALDGAAYAAQRIVPGDVLTQTCTFIVHLAEGATASIAVSTPTWHTTNGLTRELTASAAYRVNGAPTRVAPVAVADGDVVTAVVTVALPAGRDSGASGRLVGVTAQLDDVVVTLGP